MIEKIVYTILFVCLNVDVIIFMYLKFGRKFMDFINLVQFLGVFVIMPYAIYKSINFIIGG